MTIDEIQAELQAIEGDLLGAGHILAESKLRVEAGALWASASGTTKPNTMLHDRSASFFSSKNWPTAREALDELREKIAEALPPASTAIDQG